MTIINQDALTALRTLPSESVQVCVTSPPYFQLRDYKCDGQIGLEPTPEAFIAALLDVFEEVKRVLRKDGTCWVNLGSSYFGSGKGPTGHNGIGNQTKRQGFVGASGGSDPSRSLSPARAPACGSDGTAPSDSQPLDSAYSGLCDGCLADFLSHLDRTQSTFLLPLRGGPRARGGRARERTPRPGPRSAGGRDRVGHAHGRPSPLRAASGLRSSASGGRHQRMSGPEPSGLQGNGFGRSRSLPPCGQCTTASSHCSPNLAQ